MNIHERRAYEQWRRDGAIIEFAVLILAAVVLLVYWWFS